MPLVSEDMNAKMPYQYPMPADALPEIVVTDALSEGDQRMWVQ